MNIWCERGAYVSKRIRKEMTDFNPLSIKKIAVIRHAALGDMVITRVFLRELRKFFPNAEVTFSMVDKYLYGKPEDLYDKEHVYYRKKGLLKKIESIKALGKHDIIFDFAETAASRYMTLFNKSKLKIGFPYREMEQKLLYDIAIFRSDFHFEGELMLDALKILGHKPDYPLNYELPKYNIPQKKIVYFFGASVPNKQYPKKMYYELIEKISRKYKDYSHILLEGKGLTEKFEDIPQSLIEKENVSIQTTLSLEELINNFAEVRLCVSPDTGVRNVAIATHTPTVGIFYSTVPYRYWPTYENGHDAAFIRSGEIPPVEEVEKVIIKNLNTEIIR